MRSLITATVLALCVSPVQAACHKYSYWAYPYPQPCGRTAFAARNTPNWYVEITALPTNPVHNEDPGDMPFPVLLAQYKDELNGLLDAKSLNGTKYYKKPWIAQCLRTSSPEQCEVLWEKLSAPCLDSGDTIMCAK
jgi:hypothetical protein